MQSNLPATTVSDSSLEIRQFFNKFYNHQVSFPAGEIDNTVGFFLKQGFDIESARSTSIVLLNQAKEDGVNVFELLDSLKKLTDIQMSQVVAQVLNAYREKTSLLGYRVTQNVDTYETRNILV
jgi:hypothetical protein